jgi:D-alanyl-D-alanine carboxypeptidase (penicillin-binding protein 5/6)
MKDLQLPKKKTKKFTKAKPAKQKSTPKIQAKARDIFVHSSKQLPKDHAFASPKRNDLAKAFIEKLQPIKSFVSSFKQKLSSSKVPAMTPLSKLSFVRRHKGLRKLVKQNESDFQLVLFPLILLMILITLNVVNTQMFQRLKQEEFHASSVNTKLNPYPFVQQVALPKLSANAAIIVDADSQVILFSKNPELRFSMASTTKIMTALTGLDYYQLDDVLTVKSTGVEGSGLGLVQGDQFTFKDLLYAMMLPSANDAAQAIADNYPGGSDTFVQKMNEKAASLYLNKTHFSDPSGLDDDGDYTTVVDLARLASYAIANETFTEVTSTRYTTINNRNYTRQYPLSNLNKLLGTEGVTGIKTGTTEGAGEVLVTSTVKNGHTYIIVVMQSQNRFSDTGILMRFIEENVQYVSPSIE